MVFQHFSLFETLTVGENIALALDDQFDLKTLGKRIREVSADYGLDVDPQRHVHSLAVGERQRVEIVRCLLQNPRLLIMDEPTSVLTPQAVKEALYGAETAGIGGLQHSLYQPQTRRNPGAVPDRDSHAWRPRDGPRRSAQGNACIARTTDGRPFAARLHAPRTHAGDVKLAVKNLSVASADPFGTSLHDVSFAVHAGEIFGIAGYRGTGRPNCWLRSQRDPR